MPRAPDDAGRPRPSTSASYSPESSLRSRVSRLPRIGRNARRETAASAARCGGRCWCRCAVRARARARRPSTGDALAAARAARSRRADPREAAPRRSSARRAARRACPCCCAPRGRSRRPAARPRFLSRTAACRRSRESGASASRSPDVLMTTISHSTPACVAQQRGDGVRLKQRELTAAGAELQCDIDGLFARRSVGVESSSPRRSTRSIRPCAGGTAG